MSSLVSHIKTTKVSSVLNKDTRQYGKKFLFDGSEETCWNSHQGTPQFIVLDFEVPVVISDIRIMFQGGFVGKDCQALGVLEGGAEPEDLFPFYPTDTNTVQIFEAPEEKRLPIVQLKILFPQSTDFFGRITIYTLDVIGSPKE